MRVLVTGGAGYIGSHVVDLLVRDGHAVTVLDSLEKGHREAVHPAACLRPGRLWRRRACWTASSPSTPSMRCMHFAAYIEAGESMVDPGRFFVNNTARPMVLLDRMIAHGVKKFIFSSTAATYGDPEYTPIDEEHPKAPTNAYGYAKLLVEGALEWMHRLRGLGCVSLRYFNASGCSGGTGRGPCARDPPDPPGAGGGPGAARLHQDLRHGLPDPRWHLHPGLHPCAGPGQRSPAGPEGPAGGRAARLQPGQRHRLQRPGGDRGRAAGDGPRHSGGGGPAPGG